MSPKMSNQQKEQRRQEILEAAKRVFVLKGYEPATLKDIVEETGMSRGWIYLYFQTKEEIFEALLQQSDLYHEQYLEELLARHSSVWDVLMVIYSPQQMEPLISVKDSFLPPFYEYFLTGWRDAARRKTLTARYEAGIARLAKLLQLGIDRGEFTPILPVDAIVRLIASFQEGIVMYAISVGPQVANTEMQLEELIRYLKQLLQVR
ncbi:TetR family transcriptional regulator [Paenibacillus radicis (ex Gao et al. 2016)]|uniref:HTH-type transcriptional regulator YfiR n=1 Tax=Paenibacillus radicis (ex Gao et al. 2016) TaxID=1737354 RepID=A0A917H0M3_9BACL|nr:TetR family transcriptional regulator [Paenibacillus radicis (ex Gao et al. 2016)]GGG63049.1 putative HTH-type transcriptional regulator YfiR [Paenibacillus radicis (ex Gao et al. 2016)]